MEYRAEDFSMIRIPLLSKDMLDFVLDDSVDNEKKYRELVQQREFMEAIQVASPDLYQMVAESLNNGKNQKVNEKTLNSLCKYAVRASSRTTPFGLFSGFSAVEFGEDTSLVVSGESGALKKRARADAEWIDNIIVKLEKNKSLMKKIRVCQNKVAYQKGGRLINPYLCNENLKQKKDTDISASIRYSKQVEQVFELCGSGKLFEELEKEMCSIYSDTQTEVIENFLYGLLDNGFLISELRMPKANINAIEYLSQIIKRTGEDEGLFNDLAEIQNMIEAYCDTDVGDGVNLFNKLQEKMKSVAENSSYIQVDLKMHMNSTGISDHIRKECERMAGRLAKLSGYIGETYNIKEYKTSFLEKYGAYIEVPVLELLDSELGLGAPAGYINPVSSRKLSGENSSHFAPVMKALRDDLISRIAYTGYFAGENMEFTDTDIVYTDKDIEDMDKILEKFESNELPSSFEMNFFVFASDQEEIEKGNFKIGIGPNVGSDRAGRTWGRFADMLDKDEIEKYDGLYDDLKEVLDEECQLVELQSEPLSSRVGNIILNCNRSEYQVTVGCVGNQEKKQLELSDIVVGVDGRTNHFYLKSKSLNKRVKFVTFNMLNTLVESNVCRFIREVSSTRDMCVSRLVEGLFLEGFTYIPRIIYGNAIVSPKRWRFDPHTQNMTEKDFVKKFSQWRVKWKLPDIVCEKHFDHLFMVNLDDTNQVHNLYLELVKNGNLTFVDYGQKELLVKDSRGRRYYSEFVLPFFRETHPRSRMTEENPELTMVKALQHTSDDQRNKAVQSYYDNGRIMTPGQENWWYLKLYCESQNADTLLCDSILYWFEPFISQGKVNQLFFIRYADPEFHLRLRVKLSGHHYMDVIEPWISDMISETGNCQVSIHTYERELERYGGSMSYSYAEDFFFGDSLYMMYLLKNKKSDEYDEVLAVMNYICILRGFHLKLEDQIEFFEKSYTELNSLKKEYKPHTKKYIELIDNMDKLLFLQNAISDEDGQINEVMRSFAHWQEKLKTYVDHLFLCDKEGKLTNSLKDVLRSILHMHCNRFRGDNTWEKKILEFTYRSLYAYRNYKKYNH